MKRPLTRLHVVTDDGVVSLSDFDTRAHGILRAGPVALHLRSHAAPGRSLYRHALGLRAGCRPHRASLFINDRADLAAAVGADGLHLPTRGLPTAAARVVAGPEMWIGRSAHSADEAQRAGEEGADYVFLGPIWPTGSHPGRPPLGLDAIARVQSVSVIAIGGVTVERVPACLDAGAYGVAAISALWHAPEPGRVAQDMLLSLPDMTPSMTVLVNGEKRSVARNATVLDLLRQCELDPRLVVVEVNRAIVRRPTLGETVLHDGDRIELVHFVGGG